MTMESDMTYQAAALEVQRLRRLARGWAIRAWISIILMVVLAFIGGRWLADGKLAWGVVGVLAVLLNGWIASLCMMEHDLCANAISNIRTHTSDLS